MDWADKPQNYKDLYGILQLMKAPVWTIFHWKLLAFRSLPFQSKCLDFQSNQYKKLVPVLSRFCNWLWTVQNARKTFWPSESRLPNFSYKPECSIQWKNDRLPIIGWNRSGWLSVEHWYYKHFFKRKNWLKEMVPVCFLVFILLHWYKTRKGRIRKKKGVESFNDLYQL